jgi:GNAT superfamily N-acetyltransferase
MHLLHEVQHAVQKIEDFPRGGAPIGMSEKDYERLYGEVEARNVEARFMSELDDIPQTVPTQTRDTAPADMLFEDGTPAVELSRLTDLNTFTKYLGGETLPNNPNRVFFPDLEFSEVTLRDSDYVDGALDIELLRAGKKGQGHGTEMMNRITQLADDTGKTFTLTPTPYGDGGLNLEELVEFYQSKGFRYIDPDPDNPDLDRPMVRYPRKAEGGVMGMVDLARNAGRGPRGVESLVPVARNMNRSMLG